MPLTHPLKAAFLAFYSSALYREVLRGWEGPGLRFLLWLNVLIITPTIVFLVLSIANEFFDDAGALRPVWRFAVEDVASQIPPLEIEAGRLRTEAPQPHIISTSLGDVPVTVAIIDLDASEDLLKDSTSMLLFTEHLLYARRGGAIEEMRYDELAAEHFSLDRDSATVYAQQGIAWAEANKSWLLVLYGVLVWVGTLLVMFLYRTLQAALFAGAGMLAAKYYGLSLVYADVMRLACVAMAPPLLADIALLLILGEGMSLPLFIALYVGYVIFAIRSNVNAEPHADRPL